MASGQCGVVYGSVAGTPFRTCPHCACGKRGWMDRPGALTPEEVWYEQPDVHDSGLIAAVRMRMRFDLWRFPFGRDATDNVRQAVPITRQTGQVLTPTAAPDGDQIAFLSDSGGDADLWVTSTRTGDSRQITFEDDAACRGRAGVVTGRRRDRVCVVEGSHRFRVRCVGRQCRRQQPPKSRQVRPRHGVVARWQIRCTTRTRPRER